MRLGMIPYNTHHIYIDIWYTVNKMYMLYTYTHTRIIPVHYINTYRTSVHMHVHYLMNIDRLWHMHIRYIHRYSYMHHIYIMQSCSLVHRPSRSHRHGIYTQMVNMHHLSLIAVNYIIHIDIVWNYWWLMIGSIHQSVHIQCHQQLSWSRWCRRSPVRDVKRWNSLRWRGATWMSPCSLGKGFLIIHWDRWMEEMYGSMWDSCMDDIWMIDF